MGRSPERPIFFSEPSVLRFQTFIISWRLNHRMIAPLALVLFAVLLVAAAVSDVATMKIPNWVSIAMALIYPIAAIASGFTWQSMAIHAGFAFAILVVCFLLFQAKIMGGGDAKLIAAASLWTGLAAFPAFAFWTAVTGALVAILLVIARWKFAPQDQRPAFVNRLLRKRGGLPYGVAIALGGFVALDVSHVTAALTLP
jgi:prepilin peptidase CpaA